MTYQTSAAGNPVLADTEIVAPAPRRVSWGAILAGVVIAISVQLLLVLLGLGIGLSTIAPLESTTPSAGTLGIGAGAWWFGSTILALLGGGYVAALLAKATPRLDGVLHGLATWAVTLLITFYLLTSAVGSVVGGAFNTLGSVFSAAGQGIKSAASAAPQLAGATAPSQDTVNAEASAFLQPANPDPASMSREDASKQIAAEVPNLLRGGDAAKAARDRIVPIMAAQLKISQDDAAKRFDDAQAKLAKAKDDAAQQAKIASEHAASAASKSSFAAFVALLLGAVAAGLGGFLGARRIPVLIVRRPIG